MHDTTFAVEYTEAGLDDMPDSESHEQGADSYRTAQEHAEHKHKTFDDGSCQPDAPSEPVMESGCQTVTRPRSLIGCQVQRHSDTDHNHTKRRHRKTDPHRLWLREYRLSGVDHQPHSQCADERANPRLFADDEPREQDRDAEEDVRGTKPDACLFTDSLGQHRPGPEPEPARRHEGNTEPEQARAGHHLRKLGDHSPGEPALKWYPVEVACRVPH